MIPEIITIFKYICLAIGGGTATYMAIYLKSYLGKTAEEAEIVLNWEKIHAERDKKLLAEIKRLEEKIEGFSSLIDGIKEAHEKERLVWESRYIEQEEEINALRKKKR